MTMAIRIAVMNLGIIQQVGSPQELYDWPANRFVAGFIGSPAMNFAEVAVEGSRNTMILQAEGFQAPVPPDRVDLLLPYLGKRIIFGIRPENIHDSTFAPMGIGGAPVVARVDVTEPMGNEVFLYMVAGKGQLLARVDPRPAARPCQEVEAILDMEKMHAFDPETEEAIYVRQEVRKRRKASLPAPLPPRGRESGSAIPLPPGHLPGRAVAPGRSGSADGPGWGVPAS